MEKFNLYIDYRSTHNLLVAPLNLDELKEKSTKNGIIKAHLSIPFSDLVDNDLEWLNDEVSERITGSIAGLTEIGYEVGGNEGKDNVIVRVTASVEEYVSELEDELEVAEQYGE